MMFFVEELQVTLEYAVNAIETLFDLDNRSSQKPNP
jgi:hypothetical protein